MLSLNSCTVSVTFSNSSTLSTQWGMESTIHRPLSTKTGIFSHSQFLFPNVEIAVTIEFSTKSSFLLMMASEAYCWKFWTKKIISINVNSLERFTTQKAQSNLPLQLITGNRSCRKHSHMWIKISSQTTKQQLGTKTLTFQAIKFCDLCGSDTKLNNSSRNRNGAYSRRLITLLDLQKFGRFLMRKLNSLLPWMCSFWPKTGITPTFCRTNARR